MLVHPLGTSAAAHHAVSASAHGKGPRWRGTRGRRAAATLQLPRLRQVLALSTPSVHSGTAARPASSAMTPRLQQDGTTNPRYLLLNADRDAHEQTAETELNGEQLDSFHAFGTGFHLADHGITCHLTVWAARPQPSSPRMMTLRKRSSQLPLRKGHPRCMPHRPPSDEASVAAARSHSSSPSRWQVIATLVLPTGTLTIAGSTGAMLTGNRPVSGGVLGGDAGAHASNCDSSIGCTCQMCTATLAGAIATSPPQAGLHQMGMASPAELSPSHPGSSSPTSSLQQSCSAIAQSVRWVALPRQQPSLHFRLGQHGCCAAALIAPRAMVSPRIAAWQFAAQRQRLWRRVCDPPCSASVLAPPRRKAA